MIKKSSVYHMLQIGLVLSQFLPGALLPVNAAQLLYENTFERGLGNVTPEETPMKPVSCVDTKFSTVDDPRGTGKVARVFQQGGQECVSAETGKHRALLRADKPDGSGLEINRYDVDYWFGVRFYIKEFDAAYYSDNGFSQTFWNTKSSSARESRIKLRGSGGKATLEVDNRYSTDTPRRGTEHLVQSKRVTVPKGEWVDLVIQVRRATDNTGILKVWMNGDLVVNFVNTRTASDRSQLRDGPYTRWGAYWGTSDRKADSDIYFDDWRIATGSGGFDLVNPSSSGVALAAPPSPPVLLQ